MKQLIYSLIFGMFMLTSCSQPSQYDTYRPLSESPGPSDEDDPLKDSLKQVFLDKLYFAEEGLNVDSIRYANWQRNYQTKQRRKSDVRARFTAELFAGDHIEAAWHERGPNNEAGDMRVIDYVPSLDRFYAISTVGHLWTGSTAGDDWVLLNDAIQFEHDFIRVLPHNSGTRIFAAYGSGVEDKVIRYSDDEGQSWTKGTGFDFYDHWGAGRRLYALSDEQTLYYLVHTWSGSPWGQLMQIYKSTDKGETYTQVIETPVGYRFEEMDMWKPYDSDSMYVVDNVDKAYFEITHDFGTGSTNISPTASYAGEGVADGGIHVSGRMNTGTASYELFICHDDNDRVYRTGDGANWTYLSTASDNIWQKGWLADPDNDNLYVGSFQLNKTTDLTNWKEQYDQWWKYYGSSKDSMHVDIMNLDYFEKSNGTPFIIICNHAGIHVTYDHFQTTENLAWTNLNVTTLYDQTTASDGFLYFGAQDKGTFVYMGNSQANFDQLSSQNTTTGDGMIGSFFNKDQSYYSMIQNGAFACIPNRNSSQKSWYTIPGDHKSGWINPMVATVDFDDNKAYMAGGNLNGGAGSYLIEMDVNISVGITFMPAQFNYDFRANSDSGVDVIKAIGVAQGDENRIYVATEDATFFYSKDRGNAWIKSAANLPSSLIPWEIISSDVDADKVFISGTGFSNSGIYQSDDGGTTFSPLSTDIPAATFYEIALSDDEDYLYAATSEGPYVYAFAESKWYDLIGANTPIVDFTTVDNIGNGTIRFGTYGRGVWDFEIVSQPLPVELVVFSAEWTNEEQALLKWETASERNTLHFEVEHSLTGRDFTKVGNVQAVGNSNIPQTYDFIDRSAQAGINYYRLKIVDVDDSYTYSAIRTLQVQNRASGFVVYPNPLAVNESLQLKTSLDLSYSMQIYDGNGRLVFTQNDMTGNSQIYPKLPRGVYWYKIRAAGNQNEEQGKLVIQ